MNFKMTQSRIREGSAIFISPFLEATLKSDLEGFLPGRAEAAGPRPPASLAASRKGKGLFEANPKGQGPATRFRREAEGSPLFRGANSRQGLSGRCPLCRKRFLAH